MRPDLYLEHIQQLEPAHLQARGLTGLLLDIDGTLKDFRATEIPRDVQAWLEGMRRAGVRLCLLSNGRNGRIAPLAEGLGLPFIAQAMKPFPCRCLQALRKLGLAPRETAIAGDQLFADVLVGRWAGLFTILLKPTSWDEPFYTRIKRPLERWLLRRMAPIPVAGDACRTE